MARYDGSEPIMKRPAYHSAVLDEEQHTEQSVPQQYLVFRGIKAGDSNGPNDEKDAEKKERSSADDNGKGHHGVWDKTVHRQPPLQNFRSLTTKFSRMEIG
jgi:hypothetical protein